MDLRQLRYFVTVMQAGSFLAAARQLHVSQPAISMRLKELEFALGTPLFTRHSRGVSATAAGAVLLAHAQDVLAAVERAQSAVAAMRPPSRHLALGVTPTPAATLIPPVMEICGALDRPITLRIQQGSTQEILDLLARGTLDGVLSFALPPRRAAIITTPIYREDLVAIGPPELMDSAAGDIALAELASLKLVLDPHTHLSRQMLTEAARKAGLTLNIKGEIEPRAVKLSLMARNHWCSVVLFSAFAGEIATGLVGARRVAAPIFTLTLHSALQKAVAADLRADFSAALHQAAAQIIAEGRLRWQPPAPR